MVQVTIGRISKLEASEANIIQCLIIQDKALIGILHELMNRKSSVVRLYDGVGDLPKRKKKKAGSFFVIRFDLLQD